MALSLETLVFGLGRAFSLAGSSTPVTRDGVARAWARAYHEYASTGLAGAGGTPSSRRASIATVLTGVDFLTELSSGLATYWTTTVWAPDGAFSYVTASAVGLREPLAAAFAENVSSPSSPGVAARRIAVALHTYTTKMVTVTATNIQTGVTSIVNIR